MKIHVIAPILVLAFGITLQAQKAQSLADLARQERARRQHHETRAVITNETLNAGRIPSSPAPAPVVPSVVEPANDQAAPAPASVASPTDNQGRSEKSWRAAFSQAREDLKRAENEVKVLELRLNQINLDYLQRADVYNKEQDSAVKLNAANTQLAQGRKAEELARLKISQLEEELRRAGGPAGWAR